MNSKSIFLSLSLLFLFATTTVAQKYRLDSITEMAFDQASNNFKPDGKTVFEYKGDKLDEYYVYQGPNSPFKDANITYDYNSKGNVIKEQILELDTASSFWELIESREYIYDANNVLTHSLTTSQDFNTGFLTEKSKAEFSYNSAGRATTETHYRWDKSTKTWEIESKIDNSYTYDTLLVKSITSLWDKATNSWEKSDKIETWFNIAASGDGLKKKEISSVWDATINDWVARTKNENNRASNNDLTQETYFEWGSTKYIAMERRTHEYDKTINYNSILFPPWFTKDEYFHYKKTTNISIMNNSTGRYELTNKKMFHYSTSKTGSIKKANTFNLSVYPNPATSTLTLNSQKQLNRFIITSLTGQVIMDGSINNNTIDIKDINKGIYYIQVTTLSGESFTKKIIKS